MAEIPRLPLTSQFISPQKEPYISDYDALISSRYYRNPTRCKFERPLSRGTTLAPIIRTQNRRIRKYVARYSHSPCNNSD